MRKAKSEMAKKRFFEAVKAELARRRESSAALTYRDFCTILDDRHQARQICNEGGDVQAFYSQSSTLQTKFYNKNSCGYCELLSVLSDFRHDEVKLYA